MNAPERVLKAINHEEPDRVPVFEIITNNTIMRHYGFKPRGARIPNVSDEILKKGVENKEIMKNAFERSFKFSKAVGLDIAYTAASLFPRTILKGGIILDEYGRMMRNEVYEKDGTLIYGYVGGFFKNYEDYENWEPLDPNWEARWVGFEAGKEIQEKMNNEILAIPSVGCLMECSWEGFGLEVFSRILTKPKQVQKIFDDRGKFTLEVVKILAERNAQMILLWDDYGYKHGLFMSPQLYKKYIFPWLKRICDAAHKQNCRILLHSDGDLLEIFDDIINCGVDVIHPIESTTANPDYDIFKLNEKYGDKITFCGNVSPMMLAMGEISEIEAYSKKLLRDIAPGGGYIFSSGHSINPAVTLDRFEAMQNIRRKYGIYPINVPD
ncbi:MAG: uroporphyrinogen decarboxylase family protein [Candidatus Thorarchaeota archaeon]